MSYCGSEQECKRLKALRQYNVLDTSSDEYLDLITKLASQVCNVPITLISLIDDQQIQFKSNIGFSASETQRQNSFCQCVIIEKQCFQVSNTLENKQYLEHPLVIGHPYIRFYAGYPLTTPEGYIVGTLCVMDHVPRELNYDQKSCLEMLSISIIKHFELKKNNLELKNSLEFAVKCSKAQDNFLSNMSHELRSPLHAILGFTDILNRSQLNDQQKQMINIIKSQGEMLLNQINNLFDFSKIDTGMLNLENTPFHLDKCIQNIGALLKNQCDEKGINLNVDIDPKIPKILFGDQVHLNQIIMNLVGNAIKFTSKGYVDLSAKIIQTLSNKIKILFSVKDTGIGIAKNMINEIFKRFKQVNSDTTRKYGGVGLGLSISQNLVELQGGELKVKSQIGKGSEFYFEIYFEIPSSYQINAFQNQIDEKQLNNISFKNLKILVCEDNLINIKLIKNILDSKKIYYEIAENGKIGIEKLKKQNFDIILMDLQMPEMGGIECTKFIRQNLNLKIPILACTANQSESDKVECMKIGMNDYISKPFKIEDFLEKIVKLCDLQNINNNYSQSRIRNDSQQNINNNCSQSRKSRNDSSLQKILQSKTYEFKIQIPQPLDQSNIEAQKNQKNNGINGNSINRKLKYDQQNQKNFKRQSQINIPSFNEIPSSKQRLSLATFNQIQPSTFKRLSLVSFNQLPSSKQRLSFPFSQIPSFRNIPTETKIPTDNQIPSIRIITSETNIPTDNLIPQIRIIPLETKIPSSTQRLSLASFNQIPSSSQRLSLPFNQIPSYGIIPTETKISSQIQKQSLTKKRKLKNQQQQDQFKNNFLIEKNDQVQQEQQLNDTNVLISSFELKVDHEQINTILLDQLSDNNKEFKKDIISMFLEQTPQQINILDQEIQNGNYPAIKQIAHKMKSSVAIFGLPNVCKLINEIQENGQKAQQLQLINSNFITIKQNLDFNYIELRKLSNDIADVQIIP